MSATIVNRTAAAALPPLPPGAVVGGSPADLLTRLTQVRLFLCDVDGILTDATVYLGGGVELKRFSLRDGFGQRLLQRCGIPVGWISHRPSPATTQRAQELKVDFVHQARSNKAEAVEAILGRTGRQWPEVCFLGDDLVDLSALRRAGFSVTVPQAIPEAKALAHYITAAPGGHGAVREVAELILRAQGHWAALAAEYST